MALTPSGLRAVAGSVGVSRTGWPVSFHTYQYTAILIFRQVFLTIKVHYVTDQLHFFVASFLCYLSDLGSTEVCLLCNTDAA
jgi:hypothetical protein